LIKSGSILGNAGNLTVNQGNTGSFSNQGRVRALNGGGVFIQQFSNSSWTNTASGTVEVADGTSSITLAGNWNNLGTIILNAGTLNMDGTFTRGGIGVVNRTGGTLNIVGFMDNSGGTLTLNSTTGDYRIFGGTISGGTITSAGGGTVVYGASGFNRFINNLTLQGDLIVTNGQIRFESGASFTGANATITSGVLGWGQTSTLSGKNITL